MTATSKVVRSTQGTPALVGSKVDTRATTAVSSADGTTKATMAACNRTRAIRVDPAAQVATARAMSAASSSRFSRRCRDFSVPPASEISKPETGLASKRDLRHESRVRATFKHLAEQFAAYCAK